MKNLLVRLVFASLTSVIAVYGCATLTTRDLVVEVTSGTQFSITGDRSGLYFDMQGIIWRLPANGGTAVAITTASDDFRRPQLSPDGRWLVAQNFSGGAWNIMMLRTNGSTRFNLTYDLHDDREPTWSRDGGSILFSSDRSGNEDIWSIDVRSRTLTQLTNNEADDYSPAVVDQDLLFISNRSGKSFFYRKAMEPDALEIELLTDASAEQLFTARMNRDGTQMAWVQSIQRNGFPAVAINELVIMDLMSGDLKRLSGSASDVFGMAPFWLDQTTLLFGANGVIQKVDTNNGQIRPINFSATLRLKTDSYKPRLPLAFNNKTQALRGIVDPVFLPDDSIVFTALGDLWQLDTDNQARQLTNDSWVERDVTVSPDGKTLAYISDLDGSMQIWLRSLVNGEYRKVTDSSSGPRYPTFSPDGKQLAYQQAGPIGVQDFTVTVLEIDSGNSRRLRSAPKIWPGRMSWSANGKHLTVAELAKRSGRVSDGRNQLVRINVVDDTADTVTLPDITAPDFGPVASPDGRLLALVVDGTLWRMPVTLDGRSAGPPVQIFDELVESPAWSADGQHVLLLTTQGLEVFDIHTGERTLRPISHDWQPLTGDGKRIIHAGRLWDGTSDEYRHDVDILIDDERIASVKPHHDHGDTLVIDASTQTVLPGLIDHHVHFEPHKGEWVGRALLAFGITTVVEPGGLPYESREHMESWSSGKRAGPRLVFAGPQLDGARRTFYFASHIRSAERMRRELERGDQLGYGLVKTYRRLRPELQAEAVRQVHARRLPITSHAALRNLGFGGDRTEHLRGSGRMSYADKQSDNLSSYGDVLSIYAATQATLTPTIVNQGGFFDFALRNDINSIDSYATIYSPAYRKNLDGFVKFTGRNIDLIRQGLSNAGATVKALEAAGINIVAGTDSPIFPYGLALVIELQNYVDAGLSPAAALRTATTNAARSLGAEDSVGTIEKGMLADIIIVDGDPLQNISDLIHTKGAMINGHYRPIEDILNQVRTKP
jgi:Tol biopolymer transport system component